MKIYIVTSGVYSDYKIEAAFLDKGKAESYAKYHDVSYGGTRVEEYDTQDEGYEAPSSGYYHISQNYALEEDGDARPFMSYDDDPVVEMTGGSEEPRSEVSSLGEKHSAWFVFLRRSYDERIFSKEQAVEKFKKTASDLIAQLKQLRLDGAGPNEAAEALGLAHY